MDRSRRLPGGGRLVGDVRLLPFLSIPFVAIGVLMISIGLGHAQDELRLGERGHTVSAVVVARTLTPGSGDVADRYTVSYRFPTAPDRLQEGSADIGRNLYEALREGASITITYLPDDPAVNRLGSAEPQLQLPAIVIVGGIVFALAGLAMGAIWLRTRMGGPVPSPTDAITLRPGVAAGPRLGGGAAVDADRDPVDRRRVDRFTRSPGRVVLDELVQPLGGLAFLGMAWWLLGQLGSQPMLIVGVGLATLFALILLAGGTASWRRGLRLRVLEVGPDGIWMPELGRLPWSEIAEVRLEANRGAGPSTPDPAAVARNDPLPTAMTYWRLGIVPRDPTLVDRAPGGVARRLVGGLVSLVNGMQPGAGLTDPADTAPYGINAFELQQPLEAVLESVGRFTTVRGEPPPGPGDAMW